MAYRDYDGRPRYASRYEPNTSRSRNYEHVKGPDYPYDRRRTDYSAYHAPDQPTYDDRYANDTDYTYAAYDLRDRDCYPPTPPPTASYRIQRRRRASWPPCPTAEDLDVALAKEVSHVLQDGNHGDEAPNRGCIDQEPIMIEVDEEMARFNPERRFVLVPGAGGEEETTFDDVRIRGSMRQPADRQKAPPLQTDLRDPPVDTARPRSPYSSSRIPSDAKHQSSGDSYLSPKSAASSTTFGTAPGAGSDASRSAGHAKSRPAPLQTKSLFSADSRRENGVSDGSDLSADESVKLRTRRRPARYSFNPAELRKDDLRTSLHDLSSPPERVASPYAYASADLNKDDIKSPLSASAPGRDRISSPYSYTPADPRKDHMKHPALDTEPIRERISSPYSYKPSDLKEDIRSVPCERDPMRDRPPSRSSVPMHGRPATPSLTTPRSTPKGSGSSAGNTPSSPQFFNDLPWGRPRLSRQTTAETLYGSTEESQQSSKSSKLSSRPSSPKRRETKLPPSPPRSPRPRHQDMDGRIRSDPSSRPGSLNSRTGSPLPDDQNFRSPSPRIEISTSRPERVSTFPTANPPRERSRPVSRQSRYESALAGDADQHLKGAPPRIDIQSPSPARHPASKSTTSLPYPVDDGPTLMMPEEQSYQFITESPRSPQRTISDYQRGPTIVPIPNHVREDVDAARSPLRRSYSESSVHTERTDSRTTPSTVRGDELLREAVPEMPELPLPPCPRSTYSTKFHDWYTLDSAPSFDICPDCLGKIIGRSMFQRFFVRAPSTDIAKKCHFSSPWYRLAWLMTLKEKRRDLDLIFSLASITDTEEPCPGEHEDVRTWYGLPNKRGSDFIPNFHICERDLLYLEALMPTLQGYFQRIDSSSARLCSFRMKSKRFPEYLDMLLEIHEGALRSRSGTADFSRFKDVVSEHAWKRECSRDTVFLGSLWHTYPGLPEFTVCEECYDDIVYPDVKRGSRLADGVTRTLGFVPSEAELVTGEGNSCQLYSPRMRRIWARAVQDDNAVYLARKVRERRKIQRDLNSQERTLRRLLEDAMREREFGYSYVSGSVSQSLEPERLRGELEKIQREWKDWE
ncbi:ser arg-related nuclear matrix protein [Diplodia corticola]|uniref:Ser arg-related nuclear matrix protein n=1 Tax=Diplodia corticola TaxID=236234 RepID=A0A1J9S7N1_9PEZI|nr:ser arg-related nuclear matrix protein [Diplodia corticola]OJD35605.1 ser arg-related nuclear matrix protein [Diplodia corticola]